MYLTSLELSGFKSFGKKTALAFSAPITAIVGPNGSGKSNVAEAFRFVLGEQSMKSLRGKRGEDLIWNGSSSAPRANRAGAKVVFDNTKRFLNLDFDEVAIERVVHRDGVNDYVVNGSAVRLKDVVELLAAANIGASGHHIISQGEADRILSAHPRERKEMIEDALGLKLYQYKREEAAKKLQKTRENIAQVGALRKEIAPHLAFLKRHMEKVKRIAALKDELKERYREYLSRERAYLLSEGERIAGESVKPKERLLAVAKRLKEVRESVERSESRSAEGEKLLTLERELKAVRAAKDEAVRDLGRLEGEITAEERRRRSSEAASVPLGVFTAALKDAEREAEKAEREKSEGAFRAALNAILERFRGLLTLHRGKESAADLSNLAERKAKLDAVLDEREGKEEELTRAYRALRDEIERSKDAGRQAEREMFLLMAEESEVRAALASLAAAEKALAHSKEEYERELAEAEALLGGGLNQGVGAGGHAPEEDRVRQEERRRTIEKIKIRIEEAGGGGGEEIVKEYEEVKARDEFLARETADLEQSAASLESLIGELAEKLSAEFSEGIKKINAEFGNFFGLMFGGGTASLAVLKELRRRRGGEEEGEDIEEEPEEGIEISVSIPGKRIRGLDMLSGGERALTSIALIFAMSQVNPPPFLVLDETDAALDEANSKRYGDMIENLAKKSQLILITHNRETMSRAGVLYGVTMGSDGMSKLLSVKFDEAVAVAK